MDFFTPLRLGYRRDWVATGLVDYISSIMGSPFTLFR